MKDKIKLKSRCELMTIHGHPVVTIWFPSEDLISWKRKQQFNQMQADYDQLLAEHTRLKIQQSSSDSTSKKIKHKFTGTFAAKVEGKLLQETKQRF
jgi:hypothetical protein